MILLASRYRGLPSTHQQHHSFDVVRFHTGHPTMVNNRRPTELVLGPRPTRPTKDTTPSGADWPQRDDTKGHHHKRCDQLPGDVRDRWRDHVVMRQAKEAVPRVPVLSGDSLRTPTHQMRKAVETVHDFEHVAQDGSRQFRPSSCMPNSRLKSPATKKRSAPIFFASSKFRRAQHRIQTLVRAHMLHKVLRHKHGCKSHVFSQDHFTSHMDTSTKSAILPASEPKTPKLTYFPRPGPLARNHSRTSIKRKCVLSEPIHNVFDCGPTSQSR